MNRNRTSLFLLAAILSVTFSLLAACSQPQPTPIPSTPSATISDEEAAVEDESLAPTEPPATPVDNSGYPAGEAEAAYPLTGGESEAQSAYPPPAEEEAVGGPRGPNFTLDRPLKAGATTVTGQAPEDLNLAIVDVTFAGVILGTGRSNADGAFSISVSPLPEGHRVGVTISSLEGGQTMEELVEEYYPYRGEGYSNVPNIGIFYDTAIVQP
ncbi:MAG TPA: hypothetical protein VK879_13260 [Candidatus Sulfomarinibacteraceae bacterium]|nr:hypothetical protein [Candidatus Sulfomarinibacteraceae bacterium]